MQLTPFDLPSIPAELREREQWVVWRLETLDDGKTTKVPYRARNPAQKASSTDRSTWGTFDEATKVALSGVVDGIGFVFSEDDPYFGVDVDGLSPEDVDWVTAMLDSYTERSVSGRGRHIIGRGSLNGHGRHPAELGIFDRARYFVVTGEVIGRRFTIEDRQAELEAVLERFMPTKPVAPPARPTTTIDLDDRELLERAFRAANGADFRRLHDGDWSGFPSQSEADLAYCRVAAFWVGRDPARIDAWLRSSGLYREKWERVGYRERTIEAAIASTNDVYTPAAPTSLRTSSRPRPEAAPAVDQWPKPLREAAFHGLAGEIVRAIEPHSEADPAALLVQFLVVAGNVIGRGPYFTVEADYHYPNLYVCLVGETSKGRKGSSYGHIERIAKSCDQGWADRIESGLSSGEGLIWAVRDGDDRDDEAADRDEGVLDKRLLVFEPEFANVLRVLERQGNRLSSVVRDAWDGRMLRTLTRTTSAKATGAHVSIIGHITADELRRYLDRTEVANGFGNRFLWVCVRRSKSLPEGGEMHKVDVSELVAECREAVRFAGTVERTERDDEARALWHSVYPTLSEGMPGLVGALTGRAEAQAMRLAHIYALLDMSSIIRRPHLEAALAVWDYTLSSVSYVFSTALGDPLADSILDYLKSGSKSRSDLRSYVGGRVQAAEIERALALLSRFGLAHMVRETTGGRPAEVWVYGRGENVGNVGNSSAREADE